jgi:hypothetical protein
MAYYLSKERDEDVVGAYRKYQQYLREHEGIFPPGAFALATSEWWQLPHDHHCPHDAWLESVVLSEPATGERAEKRITAMRVRLLGAFHDGYIELFYPRVYSYRLHCPLCVRGLGDWLYDEFTLSPERHIVHEIEWSGLPSDQGSRWIIEASDIEYKWIPK